MRNIIVTVHSWSKHCMRGRASWECWETLKIAGSNVRCFFCMFVQVTCHWFTFVLDSESAQIFYQVCYVLKWVDLFMKIQLCMSIPWLDYFSKLDETTEIGCNLYKSASHKNGWQAKLLNRTKNRKSTHMHERQPVGCYAISKARKACAVRVTIFSRGGKFRPVSNFSTHFYCTQVTCSYVLLSYSIAK